MTKKIPIVSGSGRENAITEPFLVKDQAFTNLYQNYNISSFHVHILFNKPTFIHVHSHLLSQVRKFLKSFLKIQGQLPFNPFLNKWKKIYIYISMRKFFHFLNFRLYLPNFSAFTRFSTKFLEPTKNWDWFLIQTQTMRWTDLFYCQLYFCVNYLDSINNHLILQLKVSIRKRVENELTCFIFFTQSIFS